MHFTVADTLFVVLQTTISALQSVLQEDFKASEIEVICFFTHMIHHLVLSVIIAYVDHHLGGRGKWGGEGAQHF